MTKVQWAYIGAFLVVISSLIAFYIASLDLMGEGRNIVFVP